MQDNAPYPSFRTNHIGCVDCDFRVDSNKILCLFVTNMLKKGLNKITLLLFECELNMIQKITGTGKPRRFTN